MLKQLFGCNMSKCNMSKCNMSKCNMLQIIPIDDTLVCRNDNLFEPLFLEIK